MLMRTFVAPTLAEAMDRLREELGPDAFVIATDEPEGGPARVVAAAGTAPDETAAPAAAAAAGTEPSRPAAEIAASPLAELFARHGVPERMAALLRRGEIASDTLAANLRPVLAAQFDFAPLEPERIALPLLLAGPPGCGKTSTLAKIAALARGAGRRVRMLTTDTLRAAGGDQLLRYARAIGCDGAVAQSTADLATLMREGQEGALQLIDTPGLDLVRREDRQSLLDWCEAGETTPVLVLPAGHDAEESAETARAFAALGGTALIATRLDAARRLGNLLAAAQAGGLAFAAAGISPRIGGGLVRLDTDLLARFLLEDPRSVAAGLAPPQSAPPTRDVRTVRDGASPG